MVKVLVLASLVVNLYLFSITLLALQGGEGDAVELGVHAVATAGEDAGDAGTHDHAGELGVGELGASLVEDVAGLDVGEQQAVGVTGDLAGELLGLGALLVDGAVEAQRTVDDGTGDLTTLALHT